MGIVHHSNYLRICEEARVAWAVSHGVVSYHRPQSAADFAVLETKVRHIKPSFFGELITVELQARGEGARVFFQYRLSNEQGVVCLAETTHIGLDENLKPRKMDSQLRQILRSEQWIETWL